METALTRDDIRGIMKHAVWDYAVDPFGLYEVVMGSGARIGHFDAERVFLRMLERLSWYDLVDLLGIDGIRARLSTHVIGLLRQKDQRERYEHIRRVLSDEAVSISGWDPRYREKVRNAVLSYRWYRAEQEMVPSQVL